MTLYLQNDVGGTGQAGAVQLNKTEADLFEISARDTALGEDAVSGTDLLKVSYATQSTQGPCPTRLHELVNTDYTQVPGHPVDIIVIGVDKDFILNDGELITNVGGVTMKPNDKLPNGVVMNPTKSVLVIYDTSQAGGKGYCRKRENGSEMDVQQPALAPHRRLCRWLRAGGSPAGGGASPFR